MRRLIGGELMAALAPAAMMMKRILVDARQDAAAGQAARDIAHDPFRPGTPCADLEAAAEPVPGLGH
jgi:hypothetical protein